MNKKAVIFDYNRTVYDPESDCLNEGVLELLKHLKSKDVRLFLISKGDDDRMKQITQLGFEDLFDHITVTPQKTQDDFAGCMSLCPAGTHFFVVGDRVKKEIKHGNSLGMETIWYRQGKFKDELPEDALEEPNHMVSDLNSVLVLI